MHITREQAAAILGTSKYHVIQMERAGQLTAATAPKAGTNRCVVKFNDADVRALKRSLSTASINGHAVAKAEPVPAKPESALASILGFAQVDADKREVLLKLGQRYSVQDLAILLEL